MGNVKFVTIIIFMTPSGT